MSDPLQDPPATPHIAQLKFAKLHSPKMKSVYWRHFGFPTNEENCIITKQNVVCILCHKVLTNHGNTTNLRAHLQYRHKDVFNQIIQENGIYVPPRKPQTKQTVAVNGGVMKIMKREPIEIKPRVKVEYRHAPEMQEMYSNDASVSGNDDNAILYDTIMTYEDDDVVDSNHFTKIEIANANDIKPSSSQLMRINRNLERNKYQNTAITNNNHSNLNNDLTSLDNYQLQEALTNLVVEDMRNVESLYDPSMMKFIRTLVNSNATMPSVKEIELCIKEMHSDKYTTLSDQIRVHSQIKPYSLGFEMWTNVEQKTFLSIFFNYTIDAPAYNLVNQIYCTIEYNKFTSIDAVFEEFNLQNCTAAIINCDYDEYLKDFLSRKEIPIILSYDTIVNQCIKNVIALPAVASIIEEIKETIMRYHVEIITKDVEIPPLNDNFPWTYYELLKFFAETLFWPEELESLVASAKAIYDILSTISVTLDTLKGEEIPLSSMLSPITAKVLTKKLSINESDDNFVQDIKKTIRNTLHKLVLIHNHLTISALLDPRFHRLININNLSSIVKILTEKYNKIVESQGISPNISSPKTTENKPNSSNTNVKRSNLELFFDITESPVEQPSMSLPNSVETALKRYRTDVYCNLDESPFLWWSRMGHIYGPLKHLAYQYQCVPCVVNMNYRKHIKQLIFNSQKRYMLTGNLIDPILFLHYN